MSRLNVPLATVSPSTVTDRPAQYDVADQEPSEAVRGFRVALVNMPFASALAPSIQLGLLKAIALRAGFPVEDHYFNIPLAAQMGMRGYQEIGDAVELGELYFTIAAYGEDNVSMVTVGDAVRQHFPCVDHAGLDELCRHTIPAFVDECLEVIERGAYNVVGFTTCFAQQVASIALARRIKEKHPETVIIFGGSNMEAAMGVEHVRAFPYIDYAVSGEADDLFPELLTRLAEGRSVDDLVGLISRQGDQVHFLGSAAPIRDLDRLPTPDYDSYYKVMNQYGMEDDARPGLSACAGEWAGVPIMGSRGCWWGEKSHCTFCAFLGETVVYRSKSPERFLAELDELSTRYNRTSFIATDPIMDMKFLDGVYGQLVARQDPYEFNFCYVKSNLTRQQLKLLARAKVRGISPGIESLNTHVLKLMRKGTTKLQNVNTIRWATYYGIGVGYYLLHGFPGERPEDFADERQTMRLIRHLAPPTELPRLILERFSPNFDHADIFPTKWRRPNSIYRVKYPPHVNLDEIAFYFEYAVPDVVPEEAHLEAQEIFKAWRADWFRDLDRKPSLTYKRSDGDLMILDTRLEIGRPRSYALLGPEADVYEAFSAAPRTPAQVFATISSECPGFEMDEESVRCACDDLCDAGLMIGEGGKYLSLALPADPEE